MNRLFRGMIASILSTSVLASCVSVLMIGLQGWVLELFATQVRRCLGLPSRRSTLGSATERCWGAVLQLADERPVLWTGIALGACACIALATQMSQALKPQSERRVEGIAVPSRSRRTMFPKCGSQRSESCAGSLIRQR